MDAANRTKDEESRRGEAETHPLRLVTALATLPFREVLRSERLLILFRLVLVLPTSLEEVRVRVLASPEILFRLVLPLPTSLEVVPVRVLASPEILFRLLLIASLILPVKLFRLGVAPLPLPTLGVGAGVVSLKEPASGSTVSGATSEPPDELLTGDWIFSSKLFGLLLLLLVLPLSLGTAEGAAGSGSPANSNIDVDAVVDDPGLTVGFKDWDRNGASRLKRFRFRTRPRWSSKLSLRRRRRRTGSAAAAAGVEGRGA